MHFSVITGKFTHCIHVSHSWEAVHITRYAWVIQTLAIVLYGQTFHQEPKSTQGYMVSLCRESARYISTEDLSLWPNTAFTIGLLSVVLLGTVSNHTSQALGQISNWAGLAQNRLVGFGIDSIYTVCYNRTISKNAI